MRRGLVAAGLALCAAIPIGGAARAQEIACGLPYVISPGDTLHRIAVRAYGPEGDFETLYRANRERLRWRNPSQIEIGQVIAIPCPDGAAPEVVAVAARPEAPGAPGPSARIAAAALGAAALIAPTAAAPDDPGALLDENLFRLSLPWARPDCAAPPDAEAARLCADFLWSAPLRARYEVVVGRLGEPAPATLDTARTCRPALPARPDAPDAAACLDAVIAGDADAAALDAARFDALAALPAYDGKLREHPELTREITLHAIASRAAPGAAAAIARLDAGLAALEASGEAFALRGAALIETALIEAAERETPAGQTP